MEYRGGNDIPPGSSTPPGRKPSTQAPQKSISEYWSTFKSPFPGKIFTVLPRGSGPASAQTISGSATKHRAPRPPKTYEQARQECIRDVDRIIRECKRTNQKYRDPHFDIEWDLKSHQRDCLDGLTIDFNDMRPKGVKRVTDIFEKPQFYINGPTAGDVRQGRDGDCYLMAALCGLGSMDGLIDRVAVKHDQDVGVYGFVFHRDGGWQQTIVDDKLYLRAPDYEEALQERQVWEQIDRRNAEEEYRKAHQTGSRALYFAQCSDENETWLPLLEKAYAKAHGDYAVIDGGFVGEAVEDLTGGVSTEIYSSDILDKEKFWKDDLMKVGKEFLFGCATGFYSDWLVQIGQAQNPNNQNPEVRNTDRRGVVESHAYSIMDAKEIKGKRLLKVRNPWGKKEWSGDWSDGSEQWDTEWMSLLGHKFGNDGVFWISYDDLLSRYQHFDRTRIFDDKWSVKQCWTTVDVGWEPSYQKTKFELTLKEKSTVVIVLSQLDSSYWQGLEGEYDFELQFRLEDAERDNCSGDYIVRSHGRYATRRSVSTDLELPAGRYCVWMKIKAEHNDNLPVEDLLPKFVKERREKVVQIGTSYDLAHEKGLYTQTKEERKERLRKQQDLRKQQRAEDKEILRKRLRKQALKDWERRKKLHARDKQREKRQAEIEAAKAKKAGRGSLMRQDTTFPQLDSPIVSDDHSDALITKSEGDKRPDEGQQTSKEPTRVDEASKDATEQQVTASEQPATSAETDNAPTNGLEDHKSPVASETEAQGEVAAPGADATAVEQDQTEQPDGDAATEPDANSVKHVENITLALRPAQVTETVQEPADSQPEASLDAPFTPNTTPADPQMPTTEDGQDDDAASVDSFPSFEWDTELDMPSTTDDSDGDSTSSKAPAKTDNALLSDDDTNSSDDGDDHTTAMYRPPSPVKTFKPKRTKTKRWRGLHDLDPPDGGGSGQAQAGSGGDPDDGRKGEQLWNAVCTVGLRVYSTLSDDQVGLRVVWPELEPDAGSGKRKKGKKGGLKVDPDDMNRGAVVANSP